MHARDITFIPLHLHSPLISNFFCGSLHSTGTQWHCLCPLVILLLGASLLLRAVFIEREGGIHGQNAFLSFPFIPFLQGLVLQSNLRGGIRIQYSKNPLGKRCVPCVCGLGVWGFVCVLWSEHTSTLVLLR